MSGLRGNFEWRFNFYFKRKCENCFCKSIVERMSEIIKEISYIYNLYLKNFRCLFLFVVWRVRGIMKEEEGYIII